MRRELFFLALVACATCGLSCGQAAAPAAAAATAQATANTAAAVAQAVPQAVQGMVDALVARQQPTWGRHEAIYVTPTRYVIVYPTPEAERKKGHLRMVVVNRDSGLARIQRLREKGF